MKIYIKSCGLIINTDFVISSIVDRQHKEEVEIKTVMSSGEVFILIAKSRESASRLLSALMSEGKNIEITDDIECGYGCKKQRLEV